MLSRRRAVATAAGAAAALAGVFYALASRGETVDAHESNHALVVGEETWAWLVAPVHDPARHRATYKPYAALLAPGRGTPLTKGVGGIDTHHRGLYLGWNAVETGGAVYDFWHMEAGVYQQHVGYAARDDAGATARIEWRLADGTVVLTEERTVHAAAGEDGERCFDFAWVLTSDRPVKLRGDLHHAGMHLRLANEVCFHPWSTRYVLPEGAVRKADSRVEGAWWACCSARIDGRRYWFLHMTHPATLDGPPVYSTRPYGRVGAFWEADLAPESPLRGRFRVLLSAEPLDTAACQARYDAWAAATP